MTLRYQPLAGDGPACNEGPGVESGGILATDDGLAYRPAKRMMCTGSARPPLDSEAKAFLDFAAAMNKPPSYTLPYEEARRGVRAATPLLSYPGPEMAAIDDLAIPGPGGPIGARLYTPPDLCDPAPLLIFFHGGGFVYCDLDTHDSMCRSIATGGQCMVASIDYRLAPEYAFPAASDDALAATQWLIVNAAALDVDPNRIVIGGDSAGGNLAAGVAQAVPGLAGQLLIYPWLDMRMQHRSHFVNGDGYMLTRASLLWFRSHYLSGFEEREDVRASPILATSLAGQPPTFVMTAGYDPLHDEAIDYASRLREAGVSVHHSDHSGQIHGFAMMNRVMAAAETAVQEVGEWLVGLWRHSAMPRA